MYIDTINLNEKMELLVRSKVDGFKGFDGKRFNMDGPKVNGQEVF